MINNPAITKNGVPVPESMYTLIGNVFTSDYSGLVIDFSSRNRMIVNIKSNCSVKVGNFCVINAVSECKITTGNNCAIIACNNNEFNSGERCTFDVTGGCTFKTGKDCVAIRRDVFDIIQLPVNQRIKFNETWKAGFRNLPEKKKYSLELTDYELERIQQCLAEGRWTNDVELYGLFKERK